MWTGLRNAGRRWGSRECMSLPRAGALFIVLLVPACGRGQQTASPSPSAPTAPPVEVSYASDVWPILLVRCQVCHTVGSGAQEVPDMLMTDPSTLYNAWVRIFSKCDPNRFRVLPGDSGLSFVFNKISEPAPFCGQRMPLLGAPLEDAEQQTIRDWIDQGALHN